MESSCTTGKPLAYLVDDEPMLLDLNEAVLRSLGFEVRRFRAAEQALAEYERAAVLPEIIITDYSMHRMTGLELIEACRRRNPGQKILLVSGTVTAAVFEDNFVRPDHFMAKPYPLEEFASTIRSLTHR